VEREELAARQFEQFSLSIGSHFLLLRDRPRRGLQKAKLDELLHAHGAARNALTRLDEKEPEDIEQIRAKERRND
jgi:hypothetical protein